MECKIEICRLKKADIEKELKEVKSEYRDEAKKWEA